MSLRCHHLALLLLTACAGAQTAGPGASAEAAAGPAVDPSAKRSFDEAVALWKQGRASGKPDLAAVQRRLQAAVAADDDLAEAHHDLGVIAELGGDAAGAEKSYRRALEVKPGLADSREALAAMLERRGDRAGAEAQYEAIVQEHPEHAGARARLAALARVGGDADRAVQLAREALMRDPKNLLAYEVMIGVELDRGEVGVAKLLALQALEIDGQDPELHHRAGQVLEKAGDREAALAQYRLAAGSPGGHIPSRFRLGEEALKARDFARAKEHFEAIVKADPANARAQMNLGIALRALGDADGALQAYDRALAASPSFADPLFGKALIFHRYKDAPDKALELYRAYVSANAAGLPPNHPVFAYIKECEQLAQAKKDGEAAGTATPPQASDPDVLPASP